MLLPALCGNRRWFLRPFWKQFLFILLQGCLVSDVYCGSSKLLVLFIDGFRWDYFPSPNQLDNEPSGLDAFISRGVKAEYMVPAFPSISAPNHYTIMTGLTPEHHGIVNNVMYDTEHDTFFKGGEGEDGIKSYWYDGGEPIWITANKQGLRCEVFYLSVSAGDLPGNKLVPHIAPYASPSMTQFADALHNVTSLFSKDKLDMAVIYFANIDHFGHVFGPNSKELKAEIARLDRVIMKLENILQNQKYVDGHTKMADLVNVIFVSDHGMSPLSGTQFVNLTQFLDMEDVAHSAAGAVVYSIWPKEGKLDKVYKVLHDVSHVQVYRKEDLPSSWHYRNHDHTPPITVLAEKGWELLTPDQPLPQRFNESNNGVKAGDHGYGITDPDMRAIFVATGPHFKKGETVPPIESRDVYQVMCSVLGLHPSKNDGNWNHIKAIFSKVDNGATDVSFKIVIVTGGIGFLCVTILFIAAVVKRLHRRRIHYPYRHVPNLDQEDTNL